MFKSMIVLASSAMIAACTAPQPTVAAKPAETSPAQATKRVCEDVEKQATGSLLTTERVCRNVPVVEEKKPQS